MSDNNKYIAKINRGWIGVDLDGTLAQHDGTWKGLNHIGEPIPEMVDRVKAWIAEGRKVKVFTARATNPKCVDPIQDWCEKHIGKRLPVTNIKDSNMLELWDDRAVGVVKNTGKLK